MNAVVQQPPAEVHPLRRWREAAGWSVRKLAEELKASALPVPYGYSSLWKIEAGHLRLQMAVASALVRFTEYERLAGRVTVDPLTLDDFANWGRR